MTEQETLEETAKNYAENWEKITGLDWENVIPEEASKLDFIAGAKWQQEKMYSKEEVQVKLYECLGHFAHKHSIIINGNEIDDWFEQFKK